MKLLHASQMNSKPVEQVKFSIYSKNKEKE